MARQALTRLERVLIAAVCWFGACRGQLKGQDTIAVISWDRQMLAELGQIADTATIEHARCLLGGQHGDTLYVVLAWEPGIVQATALIMSTGPCPRLLTIGYWHNHIPRDITIMGEDRGARPVWAYCDLSPVDRRTALGLGAPLLEIISVTKDVSCAWVIQDGRIVRMLNWPPLSSP